MCLLGKGNQVSNNTSSHPPEQFTSILTTNAPSGK
jgi:hypothetical protein